MTQSVPAVGKLLDFSERTVVVTGAGGGIGRAIAKRFGEAGAQVVVHYRTSQAGAEETVEQILRAGGRAVAQEADVTVAGEVKRLVQAAHKVFGSVDVLINNAGIYPVHSLLEMPLKAWEAVIDANLKGVHLTTQAAANYWVAAEVSGSIVNIASIEGLSPAAAHAHYASAKAAVIMHTRAAALELGHHGIRVNAVAPGLISKPGLEDEWPDGVARWLDRVPLGRLGQATEVADACLFLASDGSRWTTGATLAVDGGITSSAVF